MRIKICIVLMVCLEITAGLTQEGCEDGWTYYTQCCYQFISQAYDFDAAKGICFLKGSHLTSVWNNKEYSFIADKLWHTIGRDKLTWVGLSHKPDKRKGYIWTDGSSYDTKQTANADKTKCGAVTGDGKLVFRDCTEILPAFICKKPLEMTYIVSDAFNTTHPQGTFGDLPERLLFERVWPPKLQDVPNYVSKLTTTQVSHETDCAYRCFNVDDCRAFTLRCIFYLKCNHFFCDLFSPRYLTSV